MATPPNMQGGYMSETEAPSGMEVSVIASGGTSLRKRNRQSLEDDLEETTWDFPDDGRPKTRRVNPQRLALRLDPELVAEMEALIIPGAKMPTFAVRKDFQERYQVDRRHIYDYFHSRGLRVAKEDKHTNLIRGRAMKAQAQLHASLAIEPSCDLTSSLPFSSDTLSTKSRVRAVRKHSKPQDRKRRGMRYTSIPSSTAKNLMPDPHILIAQASSVESDAGIVNSSSGTDTDWESAAPCPQFSLLCDTSDDNADKASSMSDFMPSPDDFIAGYFDSPLQLQHQQSYLDAENGITGLDSFTSMDEHRLLTADERTEFYNLINNNISKALEADGNYDDYLSDKSRSRPESLGSMPRPNWASKPMPGIARISSTHSPTSTGSPDLQKWLSDEFGPSQPALDLSVRDYNSVCDIFDDTSSVNGYPGIYWP